MNIIEFTKVEKAKIYFGILLPDILYDMYDIAISIESFENVIRKNLNIDNKRLIKLVEAVQGDEKEVLLLVVYNKFKSDVAFRKEKNKVKVENFNFRIYNYDFNNKIDVEFEISMLNGG